MIKCKICFKKCKNFLGLATHVRRAHDLTKIQYYDKFNIKIKGNGICMYDECNSLTLFNRGSNGYKTFCSIKCALKWQYKNTNRSWNQGLTKETDERIKISAKKTSKSLIGIKRSKEDRQKISNGHIKRSKLREILFTCLNCISTFKIKYWRRNMTFCNKSCAMQYRMTTLIKENKGINPYIKGITGKFWSKKNKKYIHYDSSFELLACQLWEKLDHVKLYKRCDFYIPYILNEKILRYHPDFFVEYECLQNEIVEVKAVWQLNEEGTRAKFKAAKKYSKQNNFKFVVMTEKELKPCL